MIILNFFYPILAALNEGKVIRSAISRILQILGILLLLGGVYLLVEILKASFNLPTEGTIGGLILSILFLAATLAAVQTFFYRATNVRGIGESQFTMMPIFSILVRCAGEIYATLGVAIGVGGCVFIWFSRRNPLNLLRDIRGILPSVSFEGTFVGGSLFLLEFAVTSFVVLITSYFLAESITALAEIARNTRSLARQ